MVDVDVFAGRAKAVPTKFAGDFTDTEFELAESILRRVGPVGAFNEQVGRAITAAAFEELEARKELGERVAGEQLTDESHLLRIVEAGKLAVGLLAYQHEELRRMKRFVQ